MHLFNVEACFHESYFLNEWTWYSLLRSWFIEPHWQSDYTHATTFWSIAREACILKRVLYFWNSPIPNQILQPPISCWNLGWNSFISSGENRTVKLFLELFLVFHGLLYGFNKSFCQYFITPRNFFVMIY